MTGPADRPLTYDDIAVGDRFESPAVTVQAEDITAFARAFDPQDAHTDPEAARRSFFGGLAASGWHTAALTMRLIVESRPLGSGPVVGLGVEALQWLRPVRPGDTLRVQGEVIERRLSRSRPDRGLLRVRITTLNGRDEPVQAMTTTILVPAE